MKLYVKLYCSLFIFLCSYLFLLPYSHTAASYLFFDFLKETRRLKKFSASFIPTIQHQKKEKLSTFLSLSHLWVQQQEGRFFQLSQALYLLYFRVQPLGKGNPFMQEWFYVYFPSRTINLVRVLATLILESMISSRNF